MRKAWEQVKQVNEDQPTHSAGATGHAGGAAAFCETLHEPASSQSVGHHTIDAHQSHQQPHHHSLRYWAKSVAAGGSECRLQAHHPAWQRPHAAMGRHGANRRSRQWTEQRYADHRPPAPTPANTNTYNELIDESALSSWLPDWLRRLLAGLNEWFVLLIGLLLGVICLAAGLWVLGLVVAALAGVSFVLIRYAKQQQQVQDVLAAPALTPDLVDKLQMLPGFKLFRDQCTHPATRSRQPPDGHLR